MNVLGLSFNYHDSAACLIIDGKIIAAAEEERFCRRKHTAEYPEMAIEYVLAEAGIEVKDLTHIAFYEKPIVKFDRILRGSLAAWPKSFMPFSLGVRQWMSDKIRVVKKTQKRLGTKKPIACIPHHVSHAASCYYPSAFDSAAILTMDGVGEWATTGMAHGQGKKFKMLNEIQYPHSIGLLFSAITAYLGFKVNDAEWKVMGLAPYGEPRFLDKFRQIVQMREDGSFRFDLSYFSHHYSSKRMYSKKWEQHFGAKARKPESELQDFHRDFACSGQRFVEELILNLARATQKITKEKKLCIGGGVGLNSVANWRILEETDFEEVFIQPAAGDDGGALGAASFLAYGLLDEKLPGRMTQVCFGPGYSNEEVETFLKEKNIPHEKFDDQGLCKETARLVADNKVIGWFQGRQEFGPRALGQRSIIANPANAKMKDIINAKVKYREAFRPFAPSVLEEVAPVYFEMSEGQQLPFMLMVPQVRREWVSRLPAITHQDGSARVQTVNKLDNGIYYDMIKAVGDETGIPMVINTSFNVRGEPIVTTPHDAYDCFCRTGIDILVMENFIISVKPTEVDHDQGMQNSRDLEGISS
jgi:carbamoyltransferase